MSSISKHLVAVVACVVALCGAAPSAEAASPQSVAEEASAMSLRIARDSRDKNHDYSAAMAYLVKALHFSPGNQAAQLEAQSMLVQSSDLLPRLPSFALHHNDTVCSAGISPDGRWVLTASADYTARLWELKSGKPVGEPMRHLDKVNSARFSPDGRSILTASEDGTARLWEAATGKALSQPLQHEGLYPPQGTDNDFATSMKAVIDAVFSADGKRVLTRSGGGWVMAVWDVATGKRLGKPILQANPESVEISPDGRFIMTSSKDSPMRLLDAATGDLVHPPLYEAKYALFSPSGDKLLIVCGDNTAQLIDVATGKPVSAAMRHEGQIRSAIFSPDGTRVVTASFDKTARVWDAASGEPIGKPLQHGCPVECALFSRDARRVATGSTEGARVWLVETGERIGQTPIETKAVTRVAFSPDELFLISTSDDQFVRLWDVETGTLMGEPLRHDGPVQRAVLSPDGRWVISVDRSAWIWETAIGAPTAKPFRQEFGAADMAFYDNGKRVVTIGDNYSGSHGTMPGDARLQFWDAATGEEVSEAIRKPSEIRTLFSPDGSWAISLYPEGDQASLWEVAAGKFPGKLLGQGSQLDGMAFSPDGRRFVMASENSAQIRETATGSAIGKPLHISGSPHNMAFSPDGRRLVVRTSTDTGGSAMEVWDVATGKRVGKLPDNQYHTVPQFRHDGLGVMGISNQGEVVVWDAVTGKPLGQPLVADAEIGLAIYSPDGRRVLTNTPEGKCRIWDVIKKPQPDPVLLEGTIENARFSPDGNWVLSHPAQESARLLNATTGNQAGEPLRPTAFPAPLKFSPDGRWLLGSSSNDVRLWEAPTGLTRFVSFPAALLPALTAMGGTEIDDSGAPRPLSLKERLQLRDQWRNSTRQAMEKTAQSGDWARIVDWCFADPTQRALSPSSRIPVSSYVEQEIEVVLERSSSTGLTEVRHLMPAHPLIHIALAAEESENNDEIDPNAEFFREFDTERLPADARICALACRYLFIQKDYNRTLRAAECGLNAAPNEPGCLRGKLLGLRALGRTQEAVDLEDRLVKSEGSNLDDLADAANYAALRDDYARAGALLKACEGRFANEALFNERKGFILLKFPEKSAHLAALAAFRKAEALDRQQGKGPDAKTNSGLAIANWWLGNKKAAMEAVHAVSRTTWKTHLLTPLDWPEEEALTPLNELYEARDSN